MLSTIQYITKRVNTQFWKLEEELGLNFESKMFHIVSQELAPWFDHGVHIMQTPRSRDDGKDMVITSEIPLNILHTAFGMRGKNEIKIYVECKSSDNGQIRLNNIISNVSRMKESGADYFVLVTNTHITPFTHYRIYDDLHSYGIEFILIDQYLLSEYLISQDKVLGRYVPLDFIPGVEAEYQYLKSVENGQDRYELYISFRNYTEHAHYLFLKLLTDRNWKVKHPEYETILSIHGNAVRKLIISRDYMDGINDLIFSIKTGELESQFHIRGNGLKQHFELPFIGKNRVELRENIKQQISESSKIIYIYGDAGMGKTRLVQEIYKLLNGRNYDFGFFSLGCKNIIKPINDFLKDKEYHIDEKETENLYQLIHSCKNEYRHAILLIDDLHNAKRSLLEEIRQLAKGYDSPVSIILCGRTDYSAGNSDYFSFTQWAIESKTILSYKLEPLDMEDTQNLIRSVINHIPNRALEKLTRVSQHNPLYIKQYIEYMLEVDLLTLENRHTVGILNMESFESRDYMPESVEKIYKGRWENMLDLPQGEKMRDLMLACAVAHGSLSCQQIIFFQNEQMEPLNLLLERRFMQLKDDGSYSFIHESLFLFVSHLLHRNKKFQKYIGEKFMRRDDLFSSISILDQGMLAFWSGDKSLAFKYFEPVILSLQQIDNHSSININTEIYDYLYFIYALLKKDEKYRQVLRNLILARIYIALHYYTPHRAIQECKEVLQMLKNGLLKNDEQLYNMLLEHQAHSYINAGDLINGELLLKQLQGWWLMQPDKLSADTIFDMYDKFCNIYIKQNCFDLANTYNQLSEQHAKREHNDSLLVLSYISRAKLYFYCDPKLAGEYIKKAEEILQTGISERIRCHNEITQLIYECIYGKENDWIKIRHDAENLLRIAVESSYGNSVVRSYMLLAVVCLMTPTNFFNDCKHYIDKGIDASIRFGIGTYTWQFYNLQAILYQRSGYKIEEIMRLFNTVFTILDRQSLLYIGNCNFCYGNLLALSNIAFFWQKHKMESSFYKKISEIRYTGSVPACDYDCAKSACGYVCSTATASLKIQYRRAAEKQILFYNEEHSYQFKDKSTGYFIIIS